MDLQLNRSKTGIYISTIILLFSVVIISYGIKREQFISLLLLYSLAFASFLFLYQKLKDAKNLNFAINLAFLIRILILFSLPNLSNDFYRFIWDGRMSVLGYNPFTTLPIDFISNDTLLNVGSDAKELYDGQGSISPGNYTCYPPVNQFMFIIPAFLFPKNIFLNVVILRIFLILSDLGTVYYGRKILKALHLPESNIILFVLNPFIILELTGNLHFEGVTIFFLVLAIYFIIRDKWYISALFLMLSVSVKLIPLIFIPLFLKRSGQKKLFFYTLIVLTGSVILFLPFLSSGLVSNFMSSIDLYFRNFEFNASVYYIIRWIGFQAYGWNIIQKVGPLLGTTVFIITIFFAIIPKNQDLKQLMVSMLFVVSIYYFLATTVHPWYVTIPLILSLFTPYRYTVLWSFMIILSYNAYMAEPFHENLLLVVLEYTLVFAFLLWEIKRQFSRKHLII